MRQPFRLAPGRSRLLSRFALIVSHPKGFSMLRSSKGAAAADAKQARYSCRVRFAEIETDLDALIGRAVTAVATSTPSPDAILGDFIGLASLIRSVSFHEGKLLEQAIIAIGQRNPDLVVLWQSLRLPVTPAALEAIAYNRSGTLQGLSFDADARTRVTYTPDLVVVNRRYRSAVILDVKRSVASYLDTHRLAELKTRMLATSLILPDWLYKEHKRLSVDTVGIAIVDGASAPSDQANGIWAMDEIDDLLEIDGAAEAMTELRRRFGAAIRMLLVAEAQRLVGIDRAPSLHAQWSSLGHLEPGPDAFDPCSAFKSDDADGFGPACAHVASGDMIGKNFRSASPPIPRSIRFGFAKGRLGA
ncbi:hypothetical protein [Aurantimonas coralicida]|uniref:Uncharacterized protein n=1 Tax=Aurantimonas coralicida TaxID=182270 RepID=A0A0P0YZX1_9HYPH|nr:hypothetical protein [Aurantimonas coralicida]BAT26878.1 hypothetical protein [Aurantimonas coralicida]